jgi:hypothetical protein
VQGNVDEIRIGHSMNSEEMDGMNRKGIGGYIREK